MKNRPLSPLALVGVVSAVLLVIAVSAMSQNQQRVQSTTQLTVGTPVVAGPLAEWETHYAEAMKVATELAASGSIDHARRLADDLEDLDRVLRDYVRVSERLRHKNHALAETMMFLAQQNAIQMESRRYQTLTNAARAAHDVENSSVKNTRR
jgi:competence protein ComGC